MARQRKVKFAKNCRYAESETAATSEEVGDMIQHSLTIYIIVQRIISNLAQRAIDHRAAIKTLELYVIVK